LIHITKVPIMLIGVAGYFCSDQDSIINFLKSKYDFKNGDDKVKEWIEAKRKAGKKTEEDWVELLKMVKNNFKENYYVTNLDLERLKEYRKSPLFLLLAVDNKLSDKYKIWEKDYPLINFKTFMEQNDKWWEEDKNHKIMSIADFTVKSEDDLRKIMTENVETSDDEKKVLSPLRSKKDVYFMYLAELVASRTNCMSRKVGCVLVKDGYRVIATGYNGTPTGLKHCIGGYCKSCNGEDKEFCKCIHAEENALMIAGIPYKKGLKEVEELFNEAKEIEKERLSDNKLPPKKFMLYPL
ncbi:25074_t:CDS:2, partial [Dentiscutata erythropus]